MPRHKGKVERGVDYVQENALKGRTFTTLEAQNQYLIHWEANVADTRIHGTIKKLITATELVRLRVVDALYQPTRVQDLPVSSTVIVVFDGGPESLQRKLRGELLCLASHETGITLDMR